mmetsp:Transcript_46413/g.63216  ORF Transcript_46413/g.63216 Transcript_46413/m.63216 type:complete len:86 (+) Transcript_46413:3-260(+)
MLEKRADLSHKLKSSSRDRAEVNAASMNPAELNRRVEELQQDLSVREERIKELEHAVEQLRQGNLSYESRIREIVAEGRVTLMLF